MGKVKYLKGKKRKKKYIYLVYFLLSLITKKSRKSESAENKSHCQFKVANFKLWRDGMVWGVIINKQILIKGADRRGMRGIEKTSGPFVASDVRLIL